MNHESTTKKKTSKRWGALGLLIVAFFGSLFFFGRPRADHFSGVPKEVSLWDNGLSFFFHDVSEKTVGDFLAARGLELGEKEIVFPPVETGLTPGIEIRVTRAQSITVQVDGKKQSFVVLATSVEEALPEVGITLDPDDIVKPERSAVVSRGLSITVTRVSIEEQTVEKAVAFDRETNEDSTLSWRKTVVTHKGEKGLDRLVYRVSRYDGKEVNRKLLRTERAKEPVTEVVTQGTYVKLGTSHTGGASWYAFTGTLAAANPWLPKGSYVKVTNLDNGKSVIVVINDRGPFVPGRIIDLDKVAFQKIASIGAGVITVKMEEIIN